MVYRTLIFIFAITKIIISVDVLETIHETGNSTTYNCVFYGIRCHPHLSFPCCESNNKCTKIFEWSVKRHIFVCLKPVLIGDLCQTDLDCVTVKNSWCNQNKKCECVNNGVQLNPSTCSSLIGGHCLTNDDCLILNTVCTDNLCTCKPFFVYRHQHQCIPTTLGSSCEHNDDCDDLGHSECSEEKICVCKPHRFIKHNTCQPRLGTFCEDSRRCTIENSLCVYNKCQCKHGYVYISYRRCEKSTHGAFCQSDDNCALIKYMKCSENNRCVCHDKTILINNATCAPILGGFCEKHTECIVDDSVCFNNKCQCKPKYKAVADDECIISSLRKPCVDTLDCDDIWHMKCSENKTCICKANHIEVNQALCKPLLGAICHSNECGVNNSVCVDYECQCKPSFRRVSNNLCMSSSLGQYCKYNYHCQDTPHSRCSTNYKCVCQKNHVTINNATCSPLLGGLCETDEVCRIEHSVCINNRCQCTDSYISLSNYFCIPI